MIRAAQPNPALQWQVTAPGAYQMCGLSFAALAELVIGVYCLENSLDETVRRLRLQDRKGAHSEEYADEGQLEEWVFDAA